MTEPITPAHPDAIAGVTVVHHHQVVGHYPADHVQVVESQHDSEHGSDRVLLVLDGNGNQVARFGADEWHVATAPGDFGCGSGDEIDCEHCHAGQEPAP